MLGTFGSQRVKIGKLVVFKYRIELEVRNVGFKDGANRGEPEENSRSKDKN